MRRALLNLCAGFTLLWKAVYSTNQNIGTTDDAVKADYPITSFIQTFTQKT